PRPVPGKHGPGRRPQRADQSAGGRRAGGGARVAGAAGRDRRDRLSAVPPHRRDQGRRHAGAGRAARHDGELDLHRRPRFPGQRVVHLAVSAPGLGAACQDGGRHRGRREQADQEEDVNQVNSAQRTALLVHPSVELYGSDRMFAESVLGLVEQDWRDEVALPGDGDLARLLRSEGGDVRFCPTPVLQKAAHRPAGIVRLVLDTLRAIGPMLRLTREVRPDAVYLNTVTVPLWSALARVLRLPVVTHVHEAEDDVPLIIRKALAAPLLAGHTVIANSEASARSVVTAIPRLGPRTQVIYNGVVGPSRDPHVHDSP